MHTFVHAVNISNVYIRLDEAWIHVQWHTNINKIRAQILCKWKQSILWTHDNNRHSLLGSSWMTWGYGVLCFHAKGDVPVVWATRSPNQNCSTWDLLFLNRFLCPINHCNPIRTCNVKNSMKASTPVSNPPRSSRRSNSNSDFHRVIRVNLWDELNFTPISRAHVIRAIICECYGPLLISCVHCRSHWSPLLTRRWFVRQWSQVQKSSGERESVVWCLHAQLAGLGKTPSLCIIVRRSPTSTGGLIAYWCPHSPGIHVEPNRQLPKFN